MSSGSTMGFSYRQQRLWAEDVALTDIADRFGTPCYVYSRAILENNFARYEQAFGAQPHQVCYAVKANGNLALLNLLARLGAGFDIVSEGELDRVIAAGGDLRKVVFSGVGKRRSEIRRALEAGVGCLNVESLPELLRINEIAAELGCRASISIRVNPDVDPKTHPYISTGLHQNKFGVPMQEARAIYAQASELSNLNLRGVACHIGSQLTSLEPFVDAVTLVAALADELRGSGIRITRVDVGGGLGVSYHGETPPSVESYIAAISGVVGPGYEIVIEPGRSLAAKAGLLLTTVEYIKQTPTKNFAICDAAMTELIRPALYDAWHEVLNVEPTVTDDAKNFDLVGPVCETGDFLASNRELRIDPGSRLALMDAGAYGFAMASNYNARPRPCEVLVDRSTVSLIRARETFADLIRGERMIAADEKKP